MRGLAAIRVAHETEVQVPEGLLFTEFHMLCCFFGSGRVLSTKKPKSPVQSSWVVWSQEAQYEAEARQQTASFVKDTLETSPTPL